MSGGALLVAKGTSSGYVPGLVIRSSDGALCTMCFWDGAVGISILGPNIDDGIAHHVVITYDGTTEKLYVDGVLAGSATRGQTSFDSSYEFWLCSGPTATWSQGNGGEFPLEAYVDDFASWSRALSATEIANWHSGTFPSASNLLTLYHLDETSGAILTDASGNGNNGTYVGGPTLGQAALTSGTSVLFNSSSTEQYAVIPNAAIPWTTSPFSFGMFVQTTTVVPNFTSIRDGDWSDTNTWANGLIPGAGDVPTILTNVTVSDARIIGTSPSDQTTLALKVQSTKTLSILNGGSLEVRGNIDLTAGAAIEVQGGASFQFNSSLAATPSTQYICRIGIGDYDTAQFRTRGSSGNRATVFSNAGGGPGSFCPAGVYGYWRSGYFSLHYTDIIRIGTRGGQSSFSYNQDTTLVPAVDVDHCVFDTCGPISINLIYLGYDATGWSFTNSTWKNSGLDNICIHTANTPAPAVGVTREVVNCVFDEQIVMSFIGMTCDNNMFMNTFSNGTNNGPFASFSNNHIVNYFGANRTLNRYGDWSNCLLQNDGSQLDPYTGVYVATWEATATVFNPHWTTTGGMNSHVDHCIFEDFGSTDDGDCDLHNETAGVLSKLTYCIGFAQDHAQTNPGTLCTHISSGNNDYEHCTWQTAQVGAIAIGEADPGIVGQYPSVQSNIFFQNRADFSGGSVYKIGSYSTAGITPDVVTIADYNCGWQINTTGGVGGKGYNVPFSSNPAPGAHDIDVNPQFKNSDVCFANWVASIEANWPGNATPTRLDYNARGLHKLRLKNEPSHVDYDVRYNFADYMAYVRAGFAPQNTAIQNAGHDGVTIGAVEMAPISIPISISDVIGLGLHIGLQI